MVSWTSWGELPEIPRSSLEYGDATEADAIVVQFNDLPVVPKLDRFVHYELIVSTTANASSVTVLLDGLRVLTVSASLHEGTAPFHIAAGIHGTDGAGSAVSAYVDDVVVTRL